jgi:Tol biopolymer transport system component
MLRGVFRLALFAAALIVLIPSASASIAVRPGFDTAPRISPDERWILFDRYFASGNRYSPASHSLRIVDSEGLTERELIPVTQGTIVAKWTPGNLIHVTSGQEVFLLRPEDGTRVGPAHPAAAFSPDGRWIAYVTERELWVSSPDGSNARRVASASSWISVGAFSPDSTRLSYARPVSRDLKASEIVAIDGTGRVQLREAPVVGAGVWAPDSSAVVFVAQNDRGRYRPPQIYVAGADGTRVRRLVQGFATSPQWSPRGDWISYVRQVRTRSGERYYMMLVRPDGSGLGRVRLGIDRQLTGGATWLSDGRRMLTSDNGVCFRAGIVEVGIEEGTVKRLTNHCRIRGTRGADNLRGTSLRDVIFGLGGNDTIAGRGGNDDLFGGPGDDVLLARDGRTDHLDCGPGRDRAVADRLDRVSRTCERVAR